MTSITPFLWFDTTAEQAADFYASVFDRATVKQKTHYPEGAPGKAGTVMTVELEIEGQHFTALNGGPDFTINPSISFFVSCPTKEKIDKIWNAMLAGGGQALMPLQQYPWNEHYGWLQDQFGVSWQFFLEDRAQVIAPCLMFSGDLCGKAGDAMAFYLSIFPDSKTVLLSEYAPGEAQTAAKVKHARFSLSGQEFVTMDSGMPHEVPFNSAVSFVVHTADQAETDRYWNALTKGGKEVQCGWLTDAYGISWQIIPDSLGTYVGGSDPEGAARAMQAMLGMKKIDIDALKSAYEGK